MPTYARSRKKQEARGTFYGREEEPKIQMTLDDYDHEEESSENTNERRLKNGIYKN